MPRKLLYFTQPGCPPCVTTRPKVEEAARLAGVELVVHDVAQDPVGNALAQHYRVKVTPTAVVVDEQGTRKLGQVGAMVNVDTLVRHLTTL